MTYDASDPRQVRERLNQLRVNETIRIEVVRKVMDTKEGRAWVFSILEKCHPWRTSFSLDPLAMAFNEGERNIGLIIINDLMAASTPSYMAMIKEDEEVKELERLMKRQQETGDYDDGFDTTAAG